MNYELAKKLKEAGFTQKGIMTIDKSNQLYRCCRPENCYCPKCEPWDDNDNWYAVVPTLSELIEACGEHIALVKSGLMNDDYTWECFTYIAEADSDATIGIDYYLGGNSSKSNGKTPEEAVANLWLELIKG